MRWRKNIKIAHPNSPLGDRGEILAKSQLATMVAETIQDRHLTQYVAAIIIGLDQPKVSHIVTGHLEGFSIERLIQLLTALGRDVDVIVRPLPRSVRRGRLRINPSS